MSIVSEGIPGACKWPPPADDATPASDHPQPGWAGERPITEVTEELRPANFSVQYNAVEEMVADSPTHFYEARPGRPSLLSSARLSNTTRWAVVDITIIDFIKSTTKAEASIRRSKQPRATMRLINTETLELHEFFESQAPPYVILSHTWEKDEITFQEMVTKSRSTKAKAGYKKVQDTCSMAQRRGKQWAWVDTCCIDKSSSAELTESINSMYRWYQNAHECYAYLVDFAPGSLPQDELEKCRWFTRGFTLQELIAPKTVLLFDRDWNVLGKKSDKDILKITNRITRIPIDALLHRRPLGDCAIAERMLWASTRETTHPEDRAYCLLGIFEVNMPLIYGEGDNAFRRLQEEIIKRSNDLSIFAWGTPLNFQSAKNKNSLTEHPSIGLFARSPADFRETWEHMEKENPKFGFPARAGMYGIPDFVLTNRGLNMGANMIVSHIMFEESWGGPREGTFYNLYHIRMGDRFLAVLLDKVGPGLYFRRGVKIAVNREYFLPRADGYAFAVSTIPNIILMDHRALSESNELIFEQTVSITWSSDLDVLVPRGLPNTHWDASRLLFFPPRGGIYGQNYEIACAQLYVTHSKFGRDRTSSCQLYVIIDFRHKPGGIPRAFVLDEDDLPKITSLIQQSHIPHDVLFPGRGLQSGHLLNKGPEYGLQKVFSGGSAHKSQRVTIGITSAITQPPAEFKCALGRIWARRCYTVMLHATVEDDAEDVGNLTRCVPS